MNPTFIITSAINTQAGCYPPEIRILQTQETINSIYEFFPDAFTILVDGSNQRLNQQPPQGWNQLRDRANVFIDMTSNEQIEFLHQEIMDKNPNRTEMGGMNGIAKTMAEITLMLNTFEAIKEHPELDRARASDRIFKISGRYKLSPLFTPGDHYHHDRYVFKKADASWIPNAQEVVGTDHGFASRFWSFDRLLLDDVMNKYEAMMNDAHAIADQGKYIDIEHLMYKHIGTEKTVQIPFTHCMGTIAPNGLMIYD